MSIECSLDFCGTTQPEEYIYRSALRTLLKMGYSGNTFWGARRIVPTNHPRGVRYGCSATPGSVEVHHYVMLFVTFLGAT